MNTLRYDVVMFDLDGTLIDTMGDFADIAADEMARAHGYDFAHARRRYLETSDLVEKDSGIPAQSVLRTQQGYQLDFSGISASIVLRLFAI